MAASIVFGVVAFILVGSATPGLWPEQLAATMGHQAQPIQAPPVVAKQLSGQGLDGQLTLQPSGNAWLLVFDLHTTESVTVALAYDASVLRFENNGQSSSFPTAPGNSGFVSQGSKRTVLRLESGHAGSIRVRFEASGQLLQELALEVPAGSRGQ